VSKAPAGLTAVKDFARATLPSRAVALRQPPFAARQGRLPMTSNPTPQKPDDGEEPVPFMQKVLDNPFLLLFLGVTVPTVFYLIWGVMEVANIPIAK
jgi:hypothetical protein